MHTTSINRVLTLAGFAPACKPGHANQARRRVAAVILRVSASWLACGLAATGMATAQGAFAQFCSAHRQKGALALCLALWLLGVGRSASVQVPPAIVTFDAPDAGTSAAQGTTALFNDPAGAIFGYYLDASNVDHGFLRARDGRFTTIDAPGAGTGASQGTLVAYGSSRVGAITGYYIDASGAYHGIVRDCDGRFTTFDVPAAGTGASQGTITYGINPAGAIRILHRREHCGPRLRARSRRQDHDV